ncbi:DUF317 domain-containing protein [Streptomyces sp. NPDC058861]|uniref:DUF317 domain-containing protein n=1 Tax=Streptomyces sp. NPDC058861 TaxID=3346653 RepID=UPI0036AD4333
MGGGAGAAGGQDRLNAVRPALSASWCAWFVSERELCSFGEYEPSLCASAGERPGLSVGISLEELPPLVRDADPRPGCFGWQAWAERSFDASYLWCATFSGSTPHDPVAIFAASLASPHPVPRSCLPAGVEGQVDVVRPDTRRQRRACGSE